MLAPLTTRTDQIFEVLDSLDQKGKSNVAAGIRMALECFEKDAETGSTRVVLLFTDGLTDADEVLRVSRLARKRGVAIHTILLGFETRGESLLREIAADRAHPAERRVPTAYSACGASPTTYPAAADDAGP